MSLICYYVVVISSFIRKLNLTRSNLALTVVPLGYLYTFRTSSIVTEVHTEVIDFQVLSDLYVLNENLLVLCLKYPSGLD